MFWIALEILGALSCVVLVWYARRRTLGRLPPGPNPIPFIGNLFDAPRGALWKTYQTWKILYGPIIHTRIFGRSTITLTDLDDAIALLDKRSVNYSDRVVTPMLQM
jgi:hypothetical protein